MRSAYGEETSRNYPMVGMSEGLSRRRTGQQSHDVFHDDAKRSGQRRKNRSTAPYLFLAAVFLLMVIVPLRAGAATITASAGPNGSIAPSGTVSVTDGTDQSFTITPDSHYHVADVLVDGSSAGAVTGYTFTNVTADHTIAATFAIDTLTITASANPNGSISPSGAVVVDYGATQSFLITPDPGYQLVSLATSSGCDGLYSGMTYSTGAITADCTITASFTNLSDGFETGNLTALPWVTGGNANWFVQSAVKYNGGFAAQSGPIGDSQTSSLEVTLNITSPGYVYFWVKTSTENIYDKLDFLVDGSTSYERYGGWSGNTDWTFARSYYPVPAGIHTFRWQYSKDPSVSGGSDAVWIDNISFPPYGIVTHTVTPFAGAGGSISPATPVTVDDGLTTSFTVTPNAHYHIASVTGCGGLLSATTYTTGPITGDCAVTATFAIDTNIITASADSNGSISPSGAVSVNYGADQGFTITPNTYYHVADVLVDGSSVGAVTSYTFTNVTTAHTIAATMAADASSPPLFSATAPATGSYVNTDAIGYSLNRLVSGGTGTIAFTRAGGNADGNSPHYYNLTAGDMSAGAHNISAGWSTASGGLVNGAIYTVTFDVMDGLGSAPTVTNTNILYDASAAAVTLGAPASSMRVNNAVVTYTLSKDVVSGSIVYIWTGGTPDGGSPHSYDLGGALLTAGTHSVDTAFSLVDGAVYGVAIENVVDLEGNPSAVVTNTDVTYDRTAVAITNTSPLTSSATSTTAVSYTLSEQAATGTVTFTRTGGTPDATSHGYTLSGPELAVGAHAVITNLPLVDGTIYTVTFDATDQAGNASSVSNASVRFDQTAPLDGTVTTAPGNLQIVVSWSGFTDGGSGIAGYTLVSSPTATPADCSGTPPLYTGAGATYTDTGLTNGSTYYYRVCATDNAGNISAGAAAQAVPVPEHFTVTTNAGLNGSISCNPASVISNASSDCTVAPNTGYHVADVMVGPTGGTLDSVGAVTAWTISNITTNMTISAAFAPNTYDVTTAPGPNGGITCIPATVEYNSGSSCTITAGPGYSVTDVSVGPTGGTLNSVGALTSYTIRNVAADMTISATFAASAGTVPVASFIWRTDSTLNYNVSYNASSSVCPAGATCTYSWSTGETGVTASHQFGSSATIPVTLTVVSVKGGASAYSTYSLPVTPQYVASTPTAVSMTASVSGYTVTGTYSVSGGVAPYTVTAKWGDGTQTNGLTGGTFSHTYVNAATYTVTITAVDSGDNGVNRTIGAAFQTVTIAASTISGAVTRADGATPLASALVTMKSATKTYMVLTNASGAYTSNVIAGTYTVTVLKSGYTFPASPAAGVAPGAVVNFRSAL